MADNSTPTCGFAHLLGRDRKRAAAKPASKQPIAVGTPPAAGPASILKTAKARPTAPAVSRPRAPEKKKDARRNTFKHLLPAEQPETLKGSKDDPPELAAQIVAAAARARTPTGTGVAKPTGLAAKIIAAGRKRRGEKA